MKNLKLHRCIDISIKKGDYVKLIDGSGLSVKDSEKDYFIYQVYPELTNSVHPLEYLLFEVNKVNVTDAILLTKCSEYAYLQDIELLGANGNIIRTCSNFVQKAEFPKAATVSVTPSIIGKTYIPLDNSYNINITKTERDSCFSRADLVDKRCLIVSEPFQCKTEFWGIKKEYPMIMIDHCGETHMILYYPHKVTDF